MKAKISKWLLIGALALGTQSAFASGGHGCGAYATGEKDANGADVVEHLACSKAPIDFHNIGSLQNGAKLFMNYCAGCHNAQYVRYSRIAKDLRIPPELAEKYLVLTSNQIGDQIQNGIDPDAQAKWFGAAPPDLSLHTRLRGDDWVYTYLLTFYQDPSRPTGANNLLLPNAAMPHVLHTMQNSMSKAEYEAQVGDLVNFMAWMAEPMRFERQKYGGYVILFLLVLLIPVYLLNKEFWKDVK